MADSTDILDAPPVAGVSHLALSVADLDAAAVFWTRVMGFEVTTRVPGLCFVVHRAARVGLGLTDHGGAVDGVFDERRPGLDHLALAVLRPASLAAWAERLTRFGVPHSGVVQTGSGWHLNLRAPDQVAVELYVMSEAAAAAFGLASPDDAVAGTGGSGSPGSHRVVP